MTTLSSKNLDANGSITSPGINATYISRNNSHISNQQHFDCTLETLLSTRHSIKNFDQNVKIPYDKLEKIIQLASLAPSAFNIQHWRVVRVNNEQIRRQLSKLAWGQLQVTQASELLIVCADKDCWKGPSLDFCHAKTEQDKDKFRSMLARVYGDNSEFARDEALRSSTLFCMSLMLAAESLGYQSCPMSGFDYQKTASLINLPNGMEICMAIALGRAKDYEKCKNKMRIDSSKFMTTNSF